MAPVEPVAEPVPPLDRLMLPGVPLPVVLPEVPAGAPPVVAPVAFVVPLPLSPAGAPDVVADGDVAVPLPVAPAPAPLVVAPTALPVALPLMPAGAPLVVLLVAPPVTLPVVPAAAPLVVAPVAVPLVLPDKPAGAPLVVLEVALPVPLPDVPAAAPLVVLDAEPPVVPDVDPIPPIVVVAPAPVPAPMVVVVFWLRGLGLVPMPDVEFTVGAPVVKAPPVVEDGAPSVFGAAVVAASLETLPFVSTEPAVCGGVPVAVLPAVEPLPMVFNGLVGLLLLLLLMPPGSRATGLVGAACVVAAVGFTDAAGETKGVALVEALVVALGVAPAAAAAAAPSAISARLRRDGKGIVLAGMVVVSVLPLVSTLGLPLIVPAAPVLMGTWGVPEPLVPDWAWLVPARATKPVATTAAMAVLTVVNCFMWRLRR